jgi:predicted DNA-binding transcriptional regulator AlpA
MNGRMKPVTVRDRPDELLSELAAHTAAIEQAARNSTLEDLPAIAALVLGSAARIDREISLRIAAAARLAPAALLRPLLTVPEVSRLLRISSGEVYRRAKEDLKPATVALGPGGLRFDPRELEKLIRSRTG